MTNSFVVKIIAERIKNGGINPQTNTTYVITDVTNTEYKQAVQDYILTL